MAMLNYQMVNVRLVSNHPTLGEYNLRQICSESGENKLPKGDTKP